MTVFDEKITNILALLAKCPVDVGRHEGVRPVAHVCSCGEIQADCSYPRCLNVALSNWSCGVCHGQGGGNPAVCPICGASL